MEKVKQKRIKLIGILAILIGAWLLLFERQVSGLIPGGLGVILLLWRFK